MTLNETFLVAFYAYVALWLAGCVACGKWVRFSTPLLGYGAAVYYTISGLWLTEETQYAARHGRRIFVTMTGAWLLFVSPILWLTFPQYQYALSVALGVVTLLLYLWKVIRYKSLPAGVLWALPLLFADALMYAIVFQLQAGEALHVRATAVMFVMACWVVLLPLLQPLGQDLMKGYRNVLRYQGR